MSERARARYADALREAREILNRFGRSYPEDVRPMFSSAAAGDMRDPEARAGLADYFAIRADDLDEGAVQELCEAMAENAATELAYARPVPEPASLAEAGVGLMNGSEFEGYYADYHAARSKGGLGVRPVQQRIPGSRGEGVRVVDVEYNVALEHEDLPDIEVLGDVELPPHAPDHGSAVLGIVGAQDNGYGVTGIAPEATLGFSPYGAGPGSWHHSVARAITIATEWTRPGDIILVEAHAPAAVSASPCTRVDNLQCNYVAMEYWPAVYDAIRAATDRGVHVVEAAGNGQANLDLLLPDRRVFDSGAVLVAASGLSRERQLLLQEQQQTPSPLELRSPAWFTNHGEAVDLFAWGQSTVTLGYGDHPVHEMYPASSPNETYTMSFGGTSGASPMAVGVMADLLGIARVAEESIGPRDLRALLVRSGVPQEPASSSGQDSGEPDETVPDGPGARNIGRMPDLAAAYTAFETFVPKASLKHEPTSDPLIVSFTPEVRPRTERAEAAIRMVELDFGDGTTMRGAGLGHIVHRYPGPGQYEVTLRASAASGYLRTAKSMVTIEHEDADGLDAAVLRFVNDSSTTFEELDEDVALDRRAARNIVDLRPFDTTAELMTVPYVKQTAMSRLYQYVSE
jgi:hypothetical protein